MDADPRERIARYREFRAMYSPRAKTLRVRPLVAGSYSRTDSHNFQILASYQANVSNSR